MSREIGHGLGEIAKALAKMEEGKVNELLGRYIQEKVPPLEILKEMSSGMDEVGRLYKQGEYYLAELVFSGEVFKSAMARLKPLLGGTHIGLAYGKVVIGTVQEDIHDLGKNIVHTLLECAGFEVIDLGVDVPADKFVEGITQSGASLVGMSALLTTAFDSLRRTIHAISQAGLREGVRIMIGGAVTNETIKEQIGADYYGKDASSAVEIAREVYGSQ